MYTPTTEGFLVVTPHPFGNAICSFIFAPSLLLRISNDLPRGWYGYDMELHKKIIEIYMYIVHNYMKLINLQNSESYETKKPTRLLVKCMKGTSQTLQNSTMDCTKLHTHCTQENIVKLNTYKTVHVTNPLL